MPEQPTPECVRSHSDTLEEIIRDLEALTQHSPTDTSGAKDNNGKLSGDIWDIPMEKKRNSGEECDCPPNSEPDVNYGNMTIENKNNAITVPKRKNPYLVYHSCSHQCTSCCAKSPTCHGTEQGSEPPTRQESKSGSSGTGSYASTAAKSNNKECVARAKELHDKEHDLREQIIELENREKEAITRFKEADCLWSDMERQYKEKVEEAELGVKDLKQKLRVVVDDMRKLQTNKKDLEQQIRNLAQFQENAKDQIHNKTNDIKMMTKYICEYNTRLNKANKDLESSTKYSALKKNAAERLVANCEREIGKVTKSLAEELNNKLKKEDEAAKIVRETGSDIQYLTEAVIKLQCDREVLSLEKTVLAEEIETLKEKYDNCKEICLKRTNDGLEEIKKLKTQIAEYKLKCKQCHESTDTQEVMQCCTDCRKCQDSKKDKTCGCDTSVDCICMSVKRKFLKNVFDNMYTILERKANSCAGKSLADSVLTCLKRSGNGKLDPETRDLVQNFILSTVKKNLNLLIVGGAVKTRCELDADSHKQLMVCLKDVPLPKPPPKSSTKDVKKQPCTRWGGEKECNCPKGPKDCSCAKKFNLPAQDCSSPVSQSSSKTNQK